MATGLSKRGFRGSFATGLAPWTTKVLLMARGSTGETDKSDASEMVSARSCARCVLFYESSYERQPCLCCHVLGTLFLWQTSWVVVLGCCSWFAVSRQIVRFFFLLKAAMSDSHVCSVVYLARFFLWQTSLVVVLGFAVTASLRAVFTRVLTLWELARMSVVDAPGFSVEYSPSGAPTGSDK